ncbi:S41 family peptidase [Bdellovibrionota bacterium]
MIRFLFLFLVPSVCFSQPPIKCNDPSFALLAEVANIIQQNYYDENITKEYLITGAIKGMLAQVEGVKYDNQLISNHLLLPSQFAQVRRALGGELVGIGVTTFFDPQQNIGIITSVIPNSPGAKAGLRVGDRLLAINGSRLTGTRLSHVPLSPGKTISLLIERDKQLFRLHVKQQRIKLPAVVAQTKEKHIGYIKIARFHQFVPPRVKLELKRFERDRIRGLILDLRNNPGGRTDDSVTTAAYFLPQGATIATIKKRSKPPQVFQTTQHPVWTKPLVVLINKQTSGGAEILATALRAHKRGVLIGEPTYGKASVQSIFPLSNQFALKLTTGIISSPQGGTFEKTGIKPDLTINTAAEDMSDPQLNSALEILRYKIEQESPTVVKPPSILQVSGKSKE